jgi:hypothetical protein
MGTRSIIMVKGTVNNQTMVKRLYKHWDGYPTDVFNMLSCALGENYNIDSFVTQCETYYRKGMVEATYIDLPFNTNMLDFQGDLEWIYTIDLDSKTIKVFGGGYTGKTPDVAYRKGPVNPLKYADQLKSEYQDNERESILQSVNQLKALGFKVKGI